MINGTLKLRHGPDAFFSVGCEWLLFLTTATKYLKKFSKEYFVFKLRWTGSDEDQYEEANWRKLHDSFLDHLDFIYLKNNQDVLNTNITDFQGKIVLLAPRFTNILSNFDGPLQNIWHNLPTFRKVFSYLIKVTFCAILHKISLIKLVSFTSTYIHEILKKTSMHALLPWIAARSSDFHFFTLVPLLGGHLKKTLP